MAPEPRNGEVDPAAPDPISDGSPSASPASGVAPTSPPNPAPQRAASIASNPRPWRRWVGIGGVATLVVVVGAVGTGAWLRSHRVGGFGFTRRAPWVGAAMPGQRGFGWWNHRPLTPHAPARLNLDRPGQGERPAWAPRGVAPMPRAPRFAPAQPGFGPGPGPRGLPGAGGQPPGGGAQPNPSGPAPQGSSPPPFVPPGSGNLSQAQLGRVASALGLPAADLEREVRAGKTLAMICQERGKTREEVRTAVLDAIIDAR